MSNIAFCMMGAGMFAFLTNLLKLPLMLGYLLGGLLVGPISLGIVQSHHALDQMSTLGLIFLLFMIGLELDLRQLLKMSRVETLTGLLQSPISAAIMYGIFSLLALA